MFTDNAQAVVDLAKDYAFSDTSPQVTPSALVAAFADSVEAWVLLAECMEKSPENLRVLCPAIQEPVSCPGKLPLADATKDILRRAKVLATQNPDRVHPGLIDVRHLACAAAMTDEFCSILDCSPITQDRAEELLIAWYEQDLQTPDLEKLTEWLRNLRELLLSKIYGQDHAVHAFVEGLFNAECVAVADKQRRSPRGLFIFAGPAGVGKTYLAELGASHIGRPFKRFDMSAYSSHNEDGSMNGMDKAYRGAQPGQLTEFVEKNPNAILLFDEIEKAHINIIHLFLQILDAGTLEDKYHKRNVSFRETTLIFTTNVGRKLYDHPNESGVHIANAAFHRRTILDALVNEKDQHTGAPVFPASICSRFSKGSAVLFNHLRVNELERIVCAELRRTSDLLERQYYKRIHFDSSIPMSLVLREGGHTDARTLCSQAETFVKAELFKFSQLFKIERIEDAFSEIDCITFEIDDKPSDLDHEIHTLFEQQDTPRVLLIADTDLTDLYREYIPEIEWQNASSTKDALEVLAEEDIDMVLLDLWLGSSTKTEMMTIQHFDFTPIAAKRLDQGQELLRNVRDRLPNMPVYLLSLAESDDSREKKGSVDDELFEVCVRGGGARGMVVSHFIDGMDSNWQMQRDRFAGELLDICRYLYREKAVERMARMHKVLTFDTAPQIRKKERELAIRLRNFKLIRAVTAADAGEVLDEVERPRTRFDDIVGANNAKDELRFFIDYLSNPRRFAALGIAQPKGVLLHGPPGTGKTMLARAMAGEADIAFISATASSFVTVWQGSGPQNIRDIFARARRYAPAIIFIDEIDAIGNVRTGSLGGGQANENTLNALLSEMDGFTSPSADRPVFVLAATNFKVTTDDQESPEQSARTLDPALVRRFSSSILVELPDTAARKQYLTKRLLEGKRVDISESAIELVAEKSVGMSIAELEHVIEASGRSAIRNDTGLNDEILIEALDTAREGEVKKWSPEFLKSTARHEAGHTIMYWLSGWWSPDVSIIARGSHGGGMRRSETELNRESSTREELLARIRTCLGGRGAELLYYGKDSGLTTGAYTDLVHATQIARQLICHYGMYDEFGLLATPELLKHAEAIGSPVYLKVNKAANKILSQEMEKTMKSLEENQKYLDQVASALLERNRLCRQDLEQILPQNPKDIKSCSQE